MTFSAVLFDLDGTLIDTAPDFMRIIQTLSKQDKITPPTDIAVREQVSAGASAMVRLMTGLNDEKLIQAYRERFLRAYEADICVDSRVFDPLDALLDKLDEQGIPWGIVTNKPRHLSERLLGVLSLKTRCHVLVCPEDVKHPKPNPESLLLACQMIGADPAACIYVGDHIRDIQAGNAAKMTTVLAAFGYLTAEDKSSLETWQADVITNTPDELVQYIKTSLSLA